ncbi:MAG: ATP/GTP-binding protein [Oscillospiraceae bacterium]|nr:ATP/GTP-binding protein [Oscillospiraceae bacterium]
MKKITIVTGHYGSGKTNFTANLAVKAAAEGKKVTVADLDIVNPYFRSADFAELFKENNITLAAPMYANTNLDIPAISFDLERIAEEEGYLIIDVGGDDAGAAALGRYVKGFEPLMNDIDMLYVINMYRYLTGTPEEAIQFMQEIQYAARMKHTAIVNNSNLAEETTAARIEASLPYAEKVSVLSGLPVMYTVLSNGIKADVPNPFEAEVYVKKLWDI